MQINSILEHIKKHVEISDEKELKIINYFTRRTFKKKEYILSEGSTVKYDYFVAKGCLRTFVIDTEGNEHNIMFATEDWWTGDFKGFYKKTPATHNIQALEESEVLCISKQNKEDLFKEIPELNIYFNKLFENTIIAQQTRIEEILCLTAEKRYLNFLNIYPDLTQRISQKHIASFLGITPEFLSMIRRKITNT